MALSDNRLQRMVMLCVMYVAQGIPWGFMATAVVSFITATNAEVTDEQIGQLTAMIILPWTFKLIWAPLIDSLTIRSMGRRRSWIIGAQGMMAMSLLGMLALGDITQNIQLLGWMFFIHNCFASLQDVATDALAVDILPAKEQGLVNGLMWGSKLAGKGAGAFFGGLLIAEWGFTTAVMTQFGSLLVIMLFPLWLLERPGEKRFPWSKSPQQRPDLENTLASPAPSGPFFEGMKNTTESAAASSGQASARSPLLVIQDLVLGFSLRSTFVHFFFGLLCVVGWGIVEVVTKPLYTRDLGWSAKDYSQWEGLAVFPMLLGTLLGGFLADRLGKKVIIFGGFLVYGGMTLFFAWNSHLWSVEWFAIGYLLLKEAGLAAGATGYNAIGMQLSWTKSSATMFTMYMTVSNVGHVAGNWLVGPLRETLDYSQTLQVAGCFMLVPLLLLFFINPRQVDEKKALEEE